MSRVISLARKLRPHVVDPWSLALVAVAFGVGVFVIAWQGEAMRLEIEGKHLGWTILVALGMTYQADWNAAWRVGAGIVLGMIAALAGMYGVHSMLPVTAFGMGLGLGITAICVAVITHLLPRILSFAGASVGFGIGTAVGLGFPLRPTSPADDLFTLMLTAATGIVIGTLGSVAIRSAIVWIGVHAPSDVGRMRFRHRAHEAPTIQHEEVSIDLLDAKTSPRSSRVRERAAR